MEGEAKKERAPSDVNGNAKGRGGERIKSGPGENCGQGCLRDEKVFERAGVARFFEAAVEGIESGVEIIEEDEPDEGESEVSAGLRESLAKLRAFDEACYVIEGSGAEQGLHDFHDEGAAVRLGDVQIAAEE